MLYFIVGKTSTGKDTVAKHLETKFGFQPVVSYTTRPKRVYEIDGKQHYFIDQNKMAEIVKQGHMLAYTKNEQTGIEYCATEDEMQKGDLTYIINPEGIRWFQENTSLSNDSYKIIGLNLDEKEITKRAKRRGDNPETIKIRLQSEREEFDDFFAHAKENGIGIIIDTSHSYKEVFKEVDDFVENELQKDMEDIGR
jgi:guanylate kinase